MNASNHPKISFILPILNEEKTIQQSLDSILNIDYPDEKKEILLALGKSTDKTNTIIDEYKKKHPRVIKTFDNPTCNTAIGRNICIDHSTGEYLMNYSGHVIAKQNLLTVLVEKHLATSPDIVSIGCANISPEKQNFVARTASAVFSSFIGGKNVFVQNAEFDEERFTDHISFALYKKAPVVEVGKFDPEFWCGQDAELDLRLIQKGYKILFIPKTKVYHFKRSTLKALFRQMYRYGIARVKMIKKHPKTLKVFHLIGAFFVLGIIGIALLALLQILPFWLVIGLILLYILVSMVSTALVTHRISSILASPVFAFLIHSGYGLGFLRGLIYGKL
jgi:cellulose synthase/poly-beta-1,6-N-acetylglucosamine synthase-like glycosyltransferase